MIEDVLSGLIAQPDRVTATSGLPSSVNLTPADEFKCLNLVITCPADVKPDAKLPVMVYIHGGGCLFGSNQAWLYDGGNLVARSMQLSKPVIIESLNYRLNGFGWLASDELRADNEEAGDVGVGNYGAHDTYLGLEWVCRFIATFGADPDNITLFGESGGAFMVDSHIHCALPSRFRRAILQSGTLDAPVQSHGVSIKHQNGRWKKIKEFTKTKNVEELRRVPAKDLAMAWFATEEGRHTAAVPEWTLDGAWLRDDWEETVSSKDLQVITGDVEAETALFAAALGFKPKFDTGPIDVKSAWNEIEISVARVAPAASTHG
jgi:carboxylesterase type B